ncbi:hypothetical protein [Cysteiniphilum sp. 6C5]
MLKRIVGFSAILLTAINANATCGIDKAGCTAVPSTNLEPK